MPIMFWIVKFSVISEVLCQKTLWATGVFIFDSKIDPKQRTALQYIYIQWVLAFAFFYPVDLEITQVGYLSHKDFQNWLAGLPNDTYTKSNAVHVERSCCGVEYKPLGIFSL